MCQSGLEGNTEVPMSLSPRLHTALGVLCLLAAVALSTPGVRVARADSTAPSADAAPDTPDRETEEPARPHAAPAPAAQCPLAAGRPSLSDALRSLERSIDAEARAQGRASAQDESIVLNGRGYNYGKPSVELDLGALRRELRAR
jgi:hypothetical protein